MGLAHEGVAEHADADLGGLSVLHGPHVTHPVAAATGIPANGSFVRTTMPLRPVARYDEHVAGEPRAPSRSLRIAGRSYPVILPSPKDPRLHVSATFLVLYVLGMTQFHFRLSFPQIIVSILTCAVIELVVTFRQKQMIIWPASAMLTGNGIAFIMRIPGTQHGDWWSFNGVWIYSLVGAVAMASKYLIKFRGRHIFNPSNFALVLAFVILGSSRVEPLQFWWGPLSPALLIVLLVIVGGALLVLTRVGLLAIAVIFWFTFAAALGILALSGHAFTANWHLGPVADYYFWKVLVLSPEVFIFLAFMITDPRTAPETERGRRIYSVALGLLGALLIAPMQTEYWAKVALLDVAHDRLRRAAGHHPRARGARAAPGREEHRPAERPQPQPVPARLSRRRRRRGLRGAPRRRRHPDPLGRHALLERARGRRRGHDRAHAERRLDLTAARQADRGRCGREPSARVGRARQARRGAGVGRGERGLPRGDQVADREGGRAADRRSELPRWRRSICGCSRQSTRRRRRSSRR